MKFHRRQTSYNNTNKQTSTKRQTDVNELHSFAPRIT